VIEEIDAWATKQKDAPSRSEAIRRLVELGLKKGRK
jgi:metal-responsive CopG/Arc/MetJ family transcriptional regulator